MVNPSAVDLVNNNPAIHEVLVLDKKGAHKSLRGMKSIIQTVRHKNFDIMLSPHLSHRTSLLAAFSRIPIRFGYENAGFARLAYTQKLTRPMELPELRRLLRFLDDALPDPDDPKGHYKTHKEQLLLYETEESRQEISNLMSELLNPRKPVLIAPSSVWPTKRWTPRGFAELAGLLYRQYKTTILLVGSPGDREVAELVLRYAREILPENVSEKIVNICGKTSLKGLYSLLKRSRLLVSNDSGPVHFGCAAEIPVVAVFGPTVKELGYAPIAKGTLVVEKPDLDCRPCGTHGAKRCPLGHFRCMKDLSAGEVMAAVRKVAGE